MANPATIQEIKAACPGIDSDFAIGLLERGLDLTGCQQEFIAEQNRRLQSRDEQLRKSTPTSGPGVQTNIAAGGERNDFTNDDGVHEFSEKVSALIEKGVEPSEARMRVAKRFPQLHKSFLLATNSNPVAQRLIEDKFSAA